ncbi:MAG: dihydrofolate reductase, partial [Pseudomonadales bacterium]
MTIALVAAQAENRVIGHGLDIPWRVKGEQALFKQITMG